jgi:uncharacterized protein (DUF2267 family)
MSSHAADAQILQATVASIPRITQVMAAIPAAQRPKALDAVERSYLQTMRELGLADPAAVKWVSAVMRRLRERLSQQDAVLQKMLKTLHDELTRPSASVR